jgi:Na+/melibiose symporter-like transporter
MQRISAKEKWSYAIGQLPFSVKETAYTYFVIFFYTQVHGLSGTLAGLAMFIALVWDAVSDPIVGSWSDRVRTRWGRRHPLLLVGALPTALMFLALFSPPEQLGQMGTFIWLLGVSILLRTFITIYYIPYTALGAELSTDYDERTVIAKARASMGWFVGSVLVTIAFIVFFGPTDGVDGRLVAKNYQHYGLLCASIAAVTAIICIVGTRSAIPRLPQYSSNGKFSWRDPLNDYKLIFKNRNFRLTIGATLIFGLSMGIYLTLYIYLATYFWEFTTDQLSGTIVSTLVATVAAFMLLSKLGKRFDKPHLLAAICVVAAINNIWFLGGRLMGVLPENGDALIYPLFLVNSAIGVFSLIAINVLSTSLLADIVDDQELATGTRQEGVVFAASTFAQKATIGLGGLIAGVMLDLSGITSDAIPGSVDENTLQALGGLACFSVVILPLIGAFMYNRLRYSRSDHAKVRAQLNAMSA